jgi:son of sevenless
MMSFKSFMTMDELFDLLLQRFRIQPPLKLSEAELEDWAKNKQHVIQMRYVAVIETFACLLNISASELSTHSKPWSRTMMC